MSSNQPPRRQRRRRVELPKTLATRDQLFDALAEQLPLPGYFGRNWDALEECLSDLSFVAADLVELVHVAVPGLPEQELAIYIDVLQTAVTSHQSSTQPSALKVVFPASERRAIARALPADDRDAAMRQFHWV